MSKLKAFVGGFREGFKEFSTLIINIVNLILLSIVYFIGVGMIAIVSKIARKRFLELKYDNKSSWKIRNLSKRPVEEYYRSF